MRLIIFDCDGTLVDSQATIVACSQLAFKNCDLPVPSKDQVRRIVGLSLEIAMEQLLERQDPQEGKRIAQAYREAFNHLHSKQNFAEPLFDGVLDILNWLKAENYVMGVATGKAMRGLARSLDLHDLHKYFVTLQTADLHPSKPHPAMMQAAMSETGFDPHETMIIGDTSFDIDMGKAAGCHTVGVSYGNFTREEIIDCKANHVIDQISELQPIIQNWAYS